MFWTQLYVFIFTIKFNNTFRFLLYFITLYSSRSSESSQNPIDQSFRFFRINENASWQARATSCHRISRTMGLTINNANETYLCVTGCATSWLISFQVCVHATELIRLAGVHEFIEERGIGAINLIRRFAEQASLHSRFNYRLPITSPRHIYLPFHSIPYSL